MTADELAHTYRGVPVERALDPSASIVALLDESARRYGPQPFLTALDAEGRPETMSYLQAAERSRKLAGWIHHELRVAPGELVALLPTNDLDSIVAIFGTLCAGCAALMLDPAAPPERLRQQTSALSPKAVLCSASARPEARSAAQAFPEARHLAHLPASRIAPERPTSDALLFATSGSTAASKLVAQSHVNALVNAAAVGRHHRLRGGDRILGCLPIHHVNGLHFTVLGTLAAGAHTFLAPSFDPFRYTETLSSFRPRIASVVPSILEALLSFARDAVLPDTFEYFVSAAAPLTARTARSVRDGLGVRVLQGYGLSETTNFSTTMPAGLPPRDYRTLMEECEIPSIGTALEGNEVAVLDEDGRPVPLGEAGEICIRGHNVMTRYAGNPAATEAAFRHGWFHSEDVGFAVEVPGCPQPFFVVTGRIKNIAKVGGHSVSLDEMERVLASLDGVTDAGCLALPHRFLGEEILAAIVCSDAVVPEEIPARLSETFPESVLPRRVVRVPAIPRTPTGKLRRTDLAAELGLSPPSG